MADTTTFQDRPPYRYKKLVGELSIRVLCLKPGANNDGIQGTLEDITYTSKEPFEALSYAWGANTLDHVLVIDDCDLPIPESAHVALTRFRQVNGVRRLWIDCVCIDQKNTEEKVDQISIMDQIFSQASRVLCWVGEESHERDGAQTIDLIKAVGRADFTKLALPKVTFEVASAQGLPPINDPKWYTLRQFFERPWFTRAWIVQEFFLGSQVVIVCGELEASWEGLLPGMQKISEMSMLDTFIFGPNSSKENDSAGLGIAIFSRTLSLKSTRSFSGLIGNILRNFASGDESMQRELAEGSWSKPEILNGMMPALVEYFRGGSETLDVSLDRYTGILESAFKMMGLEDRFEPPRPLPHLLLLYVNTQAQDPRDKLYALLNISEDKGDEALRPSYSETAAEVFTRYARTFLKKEDPRISRGILLQAGDVTRRPGPTLELPSWVPDWSQTQLPPGCLVFQGGIFDHGFHVAGDRRAEISFDTDRSRITLKGKLIADITQIVVNPLRDPAAGGDPVTNAAKHFEVVDRLISKRNLAYPFLPPGQTLEDVQWRTMCGNTGLRPLKAEDSLRDSYLATRKIFSDITSGAVVVTSDEDAANVLLNLPEWGKRWLGVCNACDIAEFSNSLVGLVPIGSQIGDNAILVYGTNMPLVVFGNEGSEVLRLFGPCYVHGIMDGELMDLESYPEREFTLA